MTTVKKSGNFQHGCPFYWNDTTHCGCDLNDLCKDEINWNLCPKIKANKEGL